MDEKKLNKDSPLMWEPWKLASVTKIKDKDEQLAEIDRRLEQRYNELIGIGVVMTDLSVMATLGIDDDTYHNWTQGKAARVNSEGKREFFSVEEEGSEEQKEIYKRRADCIKKWLLYSHESCRALVQAKSKADNGGNLWLLQAVYKDGAPDKDEEKGLTAEDLIAVARVVQAARDLDKPGGTC